jgi:hypothetical protein
MVVYSNVTGSKLVRVTVDDLKVVHATYIEVYESKEQVLESKTFKTLNNAWSYSIKKFGGI